MVHVFSEVFEGEVSEDVVALEAYYKRGKVFVEFSPAFLEVLHGFGVVAVVFVYGYADSVVVLACAGGDEDYVRMIGYEFAHFVDAGVGVFLEVPFAEDECEDFEV